MMDYPDAKKIATMLAAIGEPTRLRILYQLAESPRNVGALAEVVGVPMVNMSHHLGVMRQAGLLEDEKDGRRVLYRVRPELFKAGANGDGMLGTLLLGAYRLIMKRSEGGSTKTRRKTSRK